MLRSINVPGRLSPAALIALASRSFAFDGIVDTSPIRGGSMDGFVKLP